MKISGINPVSMTIPTKEYNKTEKVGEIMKKPQPNQDLADLSIKMHAQRQNQGLFNDAITPTPTNDEYKSTGLVVKNLDANAPSNDSCKRNAENGAVDDYFFAMNDGFISKAAAQICKDGVYNPYANSTEMKMFSNATLDWFLGNSKTAEDAKKLDKSLKALSQELADRMKNGKDTGLESLTTKLAIGNDSISIKELLNIQKVAKSIHDDVLSETANVSSGSTFFIDFAQKGIAKAAVDSYSKTLGGNLGDGFKRAFDDLLDNNIEKCSESWNNSESSDSFSELRKWTDSVANDFYKSFSEIDFSDTTTAKSDFQEKLNKLDDKLSNGKYKWSTNEINAYKKQLTKAFKSALKIIQ